MGAITKLLFCFQSKSRATVTWPPPPMCWLTAESFYTSQPCPRWCLPVAMGFLLSRSCAWILTWVSSCTAKFRWCLTPHGLVPMARITRQLKDKFCCSGWLLAWLICPFAGLVSDSKMVSTHPPPQANLGGVADLCWFSHQWLDYATYCTESHSTSSR